MGIICSNFIQKASYTQAHTTTYVSVCVCVVRHVNDNQNLKQSLSVWVCVRATLQEGSDWPAMCRADQIKCVPQGCQSQHIHRNGPYLH